VVRRISDEKRAAILADIQAKVGSTRAIAARHDVSDNMVRKVAKENGITDAWSREGTEKATRARQADLAALRAEVSEKYLRKAHQLLDQMDDPHLVFSFGGKENTYNEAVLERAPTGDLRNLMTASAVALDKHLKIAAVDTTGASSDAASMLDRLGSVFSEAAQTLDGVESAPSDG